MWRCLGNCSDTFSKMLGERKQLNRSDPTSMVRDHKGETRNNKKVCSQKYFVENILVFLAFRLQA